MAMSTGLARRHGGGGLISKLHFLPIFTVLIEGCCCCLFGSLPLSFAVYILHRVHSWNQYDNSTGVTLHRDSIVERPWTAVVGEEDVLSR